MLKIPQTGSENQNMKTKISNLIFLFLFIICSISVIKAQDDDAPPPPPVRKSGNKKPETTKVAKYFFVYQIDAESKVTLSVKDNEYLDDIGSVETTDALTKFFEDLKSASIEKPNAVKTKFDPFIIIKADETLNYGALINFLKKVRNLSDNQIKLYTSKNPLDSILVAKKPNRDEKIKPNPLFLITEIGTDRKVTLNKDEMGNLDDLSKLKNTLVKIFKDRESNGVFREGTNEVEKTVLTKAPTSMQLSEIMKLVAALNYSGAQPIELQIDDSQ